MAMLSLRVFYKLYNIDFVIGKRSDKRSMKLLRGSERDLKLDINSAQLHAFQEQKHKDNNNTLTIPKWKVETCKQFRCLASRRVTLPAKVNSFNEPTKLTNEDDDNDEDLTCPQNRIIFHKTFSLLIRLGCNDKTGHERQTRRHVSKLLRELNVY